VQTWEGGSFIDGPLVLKLFQNDYITSFKFNKILFFAPISNILFEWLAPKVTSDKSGSDVSVRTEVAGRKILFPAKCGFVLKSKIEIGYC